MLRESGMTLNQSSQEDLDKSISILNILTGGVTLTQGQKPAKSKSTVNKKPSENSQIYTVNQTKPKQGFFMAKKEGTNS